MALTATFTHPVCPPSCPHYWRQTFHDFHYNFVLIWPVWVAFVCFLGVSALLFYLTEKDKCNSKASKFLTCVYFTWLTMTTIESLAPTTSRGKLIVSLDAFVGLVLFGVVIWLFTTSMTH
jgi:hypothetical protein